MDACAVLAEIQNMRKSCLPVPGALDLTMCGREAGDHLSLAARFCQFVQEMFCFHLNSKRKGRQCFHVALEEGITDLPELLL